MQGIQTAFLFVVFLQDVFGDYDIRMQRDFHRLPTYKNFDIYWNVPTFVCQKYGINFTEYTSKYGIISNENDSFRGSKVQILYDPGIFPAILRSSNGTIIQRNNAIPQKGDLNQHLTAMTSIVDQLFPQNYSSMACLDMEQWRPNCDQNFGDQTQYIDLSKDDVRQSHPQWDEDQIRNVACYNFEQGARKFMETTLQMVSTMRPGAQWGYYGFPYCFNYRNNSGNVPWCRKDIQLQNNKIDWLICASRALYPSLYLLDRQPGMNVRKMVLGRMNECIRLMERCVPGDIPLVHPYMWYKHTDTKTFLSFKEFYDAMATVRDYQVGGYVLWGASNDVATEDGCNEVLSYLNTVIGPAIIKLRSTKPTKPPVFNPFAPFNDSEFDYVPVDGSNKENNTIFDNEHDYPPQEGGEIPYNEAGASYNDPQVIIYSAIGPQGSKTIFEYDKGSSHSKQPLSILNDISPWSSQTPSQNSPSSIASTTKSQTVQATPASSSPASGLFGFTLPKLTLFPLGSTTSTSGKTVASDTISSTGSSSTSGITTVIDDERSTLPPRHRRPPHPTLPWLRTYMEGFEETLKKMLTRMFGKF